LCHSRTPLRRSRCAHSLNAISYYRESAISLGTAAKAHNERIRSRDAGRRRCWPAPASRCRENRARERKTSQLQWRRFCNGPPRSRALAADWQRSVLFRQPYLVLFRRSSIRACLLCALRTARNHRNSERPLDQYRAGQSLCASLGSVRSAR
jgi:hypothetical protein